MSPSDSHLIAEWVGFALLLLAIAATYWLWRRPKLTRSTRLALTSFLVLGYGLCKAYLRPPTLLGGTKWGSAWFTLSCSGRW